MSKEQSKIVYYGEEAHNRNKKIAQQKGFVFPEYKIENDDIFILTGPYRECWVRELWEKDAAARDYIYKALYMRKDQKLKDIIRTLFCD